MNATDGSLLAAIAKSQIYRDFERAFTRGTGLPLSLHAPEMLNHETITILPAGYSKPEIFAWNKDTKFVRNRAFTTAEALRPGIQVNIRCSHPIFGSKPLLYRVAWQTSSNTKGK